jgi:hypothetical protein
MGQKRCMQQCRRAALRCARRKLHGNSVNKDERSQSRPLNTKALSMLLLNELHHPTPCATMRLRL